ncbi:MULTISPECIES: DUF5129 domain-containing protein [unclassified Arthrobacter]|uniref:DUF5129 domain-containing protein n=1 Tax=unclassified Arthrobacter TaxID=235627 RepID=UPI002E09842E|nr:MULTISPECIES: DUF5129 domain-containing protein [unclassified Arthrobacter]MEC5192128.1 putative membrane protein YgcG [Arthrobacter sp. MP_M4]MEC5203265.1 putative membrane protein YgcG [Arthrobacter sp. MP_M7]
MGIVRKIMGVLALVLIGLTSAGPAAVAVTPVDVVVADQAGVLDQNTLLPAVRAIDFYQPTKVAIYTYNGSSADNLNEEVLRFARAEHPEWISEDGQKWANGLFIFALDPVGRHVGTYMGEDRKVSLDQRDDIQNASKDLYRDAQWTDGTIAGITRGAELINQPWYRSTAFLVTAWTTVAAAVAGAGTWLMVRWRTRVGSRKELARGDASYSNVSMDLQVTELNAETIPEASRYGSTVLEKHRTFLAKYNTATGLSNQVHAMSSRDLGKRPNLKLIRSYADAAAELDALDDVIADTNALLNRGSAWAPAWDRQLAPFRADLAAIEQMLSKRHAQSDSATAAALRSFRDESHRELERWTSELAEGIITPETALDRLRDARTHLSELLKNHSDTVIAAFAKNEKEASLMRDDMESAQAGSKAKYGRTYEPSILGTVYPAYYFFSVPTFNSGFNTGVSSVGSARGGGGSTTGYGGSGGSFSGSGSSSSF